MMCRARWLGLLALSLACSKQHSPADDGSEDVITSDEAGGGDVGSSDVGSDAGSSDVGPDVDLDVGFDAGSDSGPDAGPPVVRCGEMVCADGESCCYTTGDCFDPATDPGACVNVGSAECSSNTDCADGEYCIGVDSGCLGEGRCITPGTCSEEASDVCGCDGRTYSSLCAAGRAGVRVSSVGVFGACGVPDFPGPPIICESDEDCELGAVCDLVFERCVYGPPFVPCGVDEQCPEGAECCHFTGSCFDTSCPDCCRQPPPGTSYPCNEDRDCLQFSHSHFCASNTCGEPELGGCRGIPTSCGGEFEPVCGCDGVMYTNACWADRESADVDLTGASCM